MRVQTVQGLVFRAAGSQTLTVTWTDSSGAAHTVNTLYDGGAIGKLITDASRNITGGFTGNANGFVYLQFSGEDMNGIGALVLGAPIAYGNTGSGSLAFGGRKISIDAGRNVPTDTNNHPASVSVSVYISY
jgi:hypothetical protein